MGYNQKEIAIQFKKHLDLSKRSLGKQYDNTRTCLEFFNGDYMSYQDRIQFTDMGGQRKQAMVQFNKIKPNVDAVVGFMAQNRRKAKYTARLKDNPMQAMYSKYMNALSEYIRENANADQIETEQDLDMLVNGYGAIETDISYIQGNSTTDPNGEIAMVRLDPMKYGWDPSTTQKNLIDSRWVWYFDEYELKEALDLFEGSKEQDFNSPLSDEEDGGYEYNPFGGTYDKIKTEDSVEWASKNEETVRVYNYQWVAYETFYRAKNPLFLLSNPQAVMIAQAKLQAIQAEQRADKLDIFGAGDLFILDVNKEELTFDTAVKNRLVKEFGELIKPVAFKRKCFYTAVISGSHVFTYFKNISQQGFSVKFKTGTFDASRKIWVGMVNSMMEPSKYYNKALTELMFTIASNSKGGVMVEQGAVEDIADFSRKYAMTNAVIQVNSGALSNGKIQDKTKPAMPTGLQDVVMLSDAAISDTSGVDRAFLGSRENAQESGVMYRRRIRQIVSTMARYMDSITMFQKLSARMLSDYIRVWVENNDGSVFRMIDENDREAFVMVASDKLAPEYDVTLQESPTSPDEQMETATALSAIGDKYLSVGDVNTAKIFHIEAIKNLNLDGDVEAKIAQTLAPQKDMVPMAEYQKLEQQIQQLMGEASQAQLRKIAAETSLTEAKIRTETANTADKLEQAANKGLENDLLREGSIDKVSVTI